MIFTDEELDQQPWPGGIDANTVLPRRPGRRLSWLVISAMLLALGGLGVSAANAPPAYAASSFYLHDGGPSTPSVVRSATATETAASTSITVNISSNSGDLLFAMLAWNSLSGSATVTDTAGNHWANTGTGNGCINTSASSRQCYMYAPGAAPVTSITFNISASLVVAAYVVEIANAETAIPLDGQQTSSGTSSSPSTTFTKAPGRSTDLLIGSITADATETFTSGPSFTNGTTNLLPMIESTTGSVTEDEMAAWDLPGSTANEIFSGTFASSANWTAYWWAIEGGGDMDTSAPTGTTTAQVDLTINQSYTWASSFTVGAQTVAAGTYTFTYSTVGSKATTDTVTFGYSADSGCGTITAITSWSATIATSQTNGTVSNSTGSSTSIPANSYLCWQMTVTAVGGGATIEQMRYDTTTYLTNINTPTITVPEAGLALLGLALCAPLAARWRRKRQ